MAIFGGLKRGWFELVLIGGMVSGLMAEAPFAPPLKVVGNTIRDANDRIVRLQGFAVYDANKWNDKSIVAHWKNHWKVNTIRLAMHPAGWYTNQSAATHEAYLKRVDTFLEWCKEYQIYVVFDGYHESGFTGSLNEHWPNCKKMWPMLAKRYAKVNHIIWEVYNEPYDNNMSDANLWKIWVPRAQELIDTIRSYNPVVTACIVPAVRWAQVAFLDQAKVEREQIIYAFHPYPPVYGGPSTWNKTTWSKNFGYIIEKNIAPVIIDEWHAQTSEEIKGYAPPLLAYMDEIGAGQTLWGYFPGWPNNLVSNKINESEKKTPQGEMLYKYLNSLSPIQPEAPLTAGLLGRFALIGGSVVCGRVGAELGLRIFDMRGRLLYSRMEHPRNSGNFRIPLPVDKLPGGSYLLRLDAGGMTETLPLPNGR